MARKVKSDTAIVLEHLFWLQIHLLFLKRDKATFPDMDSEKIVRSFP